MKKRLLSCAAFLAVFGLNAQIAPLKDINVGTGDSNPNYMFVYKDKIYFQADDSSGQSTGGVDYGDELWISDGSAEGTKLLVNMLGVGDDVSSSAAPQYFTEYNGELYFRGKSEVSGGVTAMHKLNAAGDGVEYVPGMPYYTWSAVLDGKLYIEDGPGRTNDLWVFDGTTSKRANIEADTRDEYVYVAPVAFKGKLYMDVFVTNDVGVGYELYTYDPATEKIELFKDFFEGVDGVSPNSSRPENFAVVGEKMYFTVTPSEGASDVLYETDGTLDGTVPVTVDNLSEFSKFTSFFVWGDKIYGEAEVGGNDQLFVFDTAANTITNLSNMTDFDHDPKDFTVAGDELYYLGQYADGGNDHYLYKLTDSGIELIDAAKHLDAEFLVSLNGKLYFEGDDKADGVYGTEFYMFDPATLSVEDVKLAGMTKVYPNPTTDYLMLSNNLMDAPYSIYDITGKTVKTGVITSERLDLSLNNGLYIFKVNVDKATYVQKIVVKK